MRHNQETLGNGCLCDSGCEACDRLAEAWEAIRPALHQALGWIEADTGGPTSETANKIRVALRLIEGVSRGR